MKRFVAVMMVLATACGGAAAGPAKIDVPAQPDAGIASAAPTAAPPPPPPAEKRTAPPGSDGPKDARGMIGEAGHLVPIGAEAILFVNNARIRTHPAAEAFRRGITTILVGWDMFMPVDLVDPIKDIDWTVIAGSLLLGSTQKNVFLAHYNVPEDRADAVAKQIAGRLANGKVIDKKSFVGDVDGATRAYIRPKPGVLAIGPLDQRDLMVDLLKKSDVPAAVRPNELMRVVWTGRRRGWASSVPHALKGLRMWITVDDAQRLRLSGEGDCDDDLAAQEVVADIRDQIERFTRSAIVRMAAGALVDPNNIWADGRTVRYDAPLDERLVDLLTSMR